MKGNLRLIRKIINTLGVLFLMLGLIPVPVLSQVGQVYAQEEVTPEPPPPPEEPAAPVVVITADPVIDITPEPRGRSPRRAGG